MKKLVVTLLWLLSSSAQAADYYIYKDVEGKITISNKQLPLQVVKHYDWQDATDAEIAATQKANREELILNKYLHPEPVQSTIISNSYTPNYEYPLNEWHGHRFITPQRFSFNRGRSSFGRRFR